MPLSLNKVMLIGNLGRDPELRYTPAGQAVANFSVATSRSYKDKKTDEWQEETEWNNITVWGDKADKAATDLRKGSKVYIEGRLKTENWADKTHPEIKHYKTSVIADNYINLDPRGQQQGGEFVAPGGGFQSATASGPVDDLGDLPF